MIDLPITAPVDATSSKADTGLSGATAMIAFADVLAEIGAWTSNRLQPDTSLAIKSSVPEFFTMGTAPIKEESGPQQLILTAPAPDVETDEMTIGAALAVAIEPASAPTYEDVSTAPLPNAVAPEAVVEAATPSLNLSSSNPRAGVETGPVNGSRSFQSDSGAVSIGFGGLEESTIGELLAEQPVARDQGPAAPDQNQVFNATTTAASNQIPVSPINHGRPDAGEPGPSQQPGQGPTVEPHIAMASRESTAAAANGPSSESSEPAIEQVTGSFGGPNWTSEPATTGSRITPSTVVQRIDRWLAEIERPASTTSMTIDLDTTGQLRITVALKASGLQVAVSGATQDDVSWIQDLSTRLENRGIEAEVSSDADPQQDQTPADDAPDLNKPTPSLRRNSDHGLRL